jgi:hypothetical protein
MAPKVAAPAAIGRQTRSAASKNAPATPDSSKAVTKGKQVARNPSSSKAVVSGGSKAAAAGGSKAVNSKVVISKATSSDVRGGGVFKTSTKAAAANKSNAGVQPPPQGGAPSPFQPRNLAGASTAAARLKNTAAITSAHKELVFTLIATKVPTLARFNKRWLQLGDALSGHSFVYGYAPRTFIADFVHDLSTAEEAVDRPTACLVFERLVELVKLDEDIPFNKRAQWVHAYCKMAGQEVPAPYDSAVVNPNTRDNSADRGAKRSRTDQELPKSRDKRVNVSSSDSDDSSESDDSPPVNQILNADTVWGVAAGFATVPHE